MAKIMIVAGLGSSLLRFRGELIESWKDLGYDVIAAAPGEEVRERLDDMGVKYYKIRLKRSGMNPLSDLVLLSGLISLMLKEKPDYLFLYTVKPVIYGSLAAYFLKKTEVFSLITGLGYVFSNVTGAKILLKKLVIGLYKLALVRNKKVFFQNRDNSQVLLEAGVVRPGQVAHVNGSGVNLDFYYHAPLPKNKSTFLLIGRLLKEKGFVDYVNAARAVKEKYPQAIFKMITWSLADDPSSINEEEFAGWKKEGIVEILGETGDVRPYIASAGVYVLPSYYGEGLPRTILEAMAMGRPIITTDTPGCRETVVEDVNGIIVPAKDSAALAQAMERFIVEPDLTGKMGRESRRIAEEKYDVHKVNEVINRKMGLV